MRRSRRALEFSNLSFLDVISCGFGAVVLLVLISTYFEQTSKGDVREKTVEKLLDEIMGTEKVYAGLQTQQSSIQDGILAKQVVLTDLANLLRNATDQLVNLKEKVGVVDGHIDGLKLVLEALDRPRTTQLSADTSQERDDEVGGIPVDSDYVIFIVDTSGSMQEIWPRVTRELENVIRIHPKIKGFQVLNDNGVHLLSGYEGRWIPDTSGRRESVVRLFQKWVSFSNSSPVEGLEVALRRYVKRTSNVSIYIFGDEYSGSSYDPVIEALLKLNSNPTNGEQLSRVHAVGFISQYSTGRFATLMREVTRRTNGTFLALPRY